MCGISEIHVTEFVYDKADAEENDADGKEKIRESPPQLKVSMDTGVPHEMIYIERVKYAAITLRRYALGWIKIGLGSGKIHDGVWLRC